jgi:hypothetical protein
LAISFKVPERNKGKGSRITIGRMCETNKKWIRDGDGKETKV